MTTGCWNALLYAIAGDDAEHHRVMQAIDDMHRALTTQQCNVAVQLHSKSKTTRHWISAGRNVRTEVLPVVEHADEPSSLTGFLNAAHRAFPAQSTALMLWAHSSGLDYVHDYPQKTAVRRPGLDSVFGDPTSFGPGGGLGGGPGGGAGIGGVIGGEPARTDYPVFAGSVGMRSRARRVPYGCRWGPDPNTGQYLTNVGMKKAIAASTRHRVEVLGLNACWMASLEVEYELRGVSDVQVASQVYAQPWPYGTIVTALTAAPQQSTEQLAKAIVASVRSAIAANNPPDAVSALRSGSAMDELATAFDAYARRVTSLIETDWEAVSKAVMVDAWRVPDPYQVDLLSLVHVLGKHDLKAKIAAAAVDAKFRSMLVANAASDSHVCGLSIFCPKTSHVDLAAVYRGTEFRTNSWANFLLAFQTKLARQ